MGIKEFKDNNGITLAYANIPDDYVIGGMLNNTIQSEHVPFTWSVHAFNQEKQINVFGLSEEKFYEYRSPMLKQSVKLLPNVIKTSANVKPPLKLFNIYTSVVIVHIIIIAYILKFVNLFILIVNKL